MADNTHSSQRRAPRDQANPSDGDAQKTRAAAAGDWGVAQQRKGMRGEVKLAIMLVVTLATAFGYVVHRKFDVLKKNLAAAEAEQFQPLPSAGADDEVDLLAAVGQRDRSNGEDPSDAPAWQPEESTAATPVRSPLLDVSADEEFGTANDAVPEQSEPLFGDDPFATTRSEASTADSQSPETPATTAAAPRFPEAPEQGTEPGSGDPFRDVPFAVTDSSVEPPVTAAIPSPGVTIREKEELFLDPVTDEPAFGDEPAFTSEATAITEDPAEALPFTPTPLVATEAPARITEQTPAPYEPADSSEELFTPMERPVESPTRQPLLTAGPRISAPVEPVLPNAESDPFATTTVDRGEMLRSQIAIPEQAVGPTGPAFEPEFPTAAIEPERPSLFSDDRNSARPLPSSIARAESASAEPSTSFFPEQDGAFATSAAESAPPATSPAADASGEGLPDIAYTVRSGDNYWTISRHHYGTIRYFAALSEYNRGRITNPDRLQPGMKVLVPHPNVLESRFPAMFQGMSAPPESTGIRQVAGGDTEGFFVDPTGVPRYRVGKGDTLTSIAQSHLGRASRWTQIYGLNRDSLPTPDRLRPGTVLELPRDASQIAEAPVSRTRP
jgi:hypothetical protein